MAVCFELVVNFGNNGAGAQAATEVVEQLRTVSVRGCEVEIAPPLISGMKGADSGLGYIEFSVWPRDISYPGPGPEGPFDIASLTDQDLTDVGEQLFDILRRFDGYDIAAVGWDPECIVDAKSVPNEWLSDGSFYYLNGVVVSDRLAAEWSLDERFVSFAEGFRWLPYTGSRVG